MRRVYATSRKTEIANLLENFLDDNIENLPPNMWNELNELAGEIDEQTTILLDHIEELEEEK